MSAPTPSIYLLHGDDEFAISQQLADFEQKLGDPALADLNTTRLDGRTTQTEDLFSFTGALPFLAKRRLVVLSHPTAGIKLPAAREKFLSTLERTPPTTALVLVEYHELINESDKKKDHWLVKWAREHDELVYIKLMQPPKGPELVQWVQSRAKTAGGQITPRAAQSLLQLVGEDPRLLSQEIEKCLAYANYHRPVEYDDVLAVTADTAEGNIFTLVDALGNRDQKKAMAMLQRLLDEQDAIFIFGMVTRQFRLLIQVREMLDEGKSTHEMVQSLKPTPQFVIDKLSGQARRFSMDTLEAIYHRLLDLDEASKSGKIEAELALQILITEVSVTVSTG
jgi:DNA polymerase-3 subunit delta